MQIHYPETVEVRRPRSLWKDTLVGVAAGVVGTWVMEQFFVGLSTVQETVEDLKEEQGDDDRDREWNEARESRGSQAETDGGTDEDGPGATASGQEDDAAEGAADGSAEGEGGADEGPLDEIAMVGPYHREDESAPQTAARVLYRKVRGREPGWRTRIELADRLHWAQGMSMGGLYGLFRGNRHDGLDLTGGLLFGAGVWLAADELAVPLLGLSQGPTAHEPAEHLQGLGAHLVYGVATAATAQVLSRVT